MQRFSMPHLANMIDIKVIAHPGGKRYPICWMHCNRGETLISFIHLYFVFIYLFPLVVVYCPWQWWAIDACPKPVGFQRSTLHRQWVNEEPFYQTKRVRFHLDGYIIGCEMAENNAIPYCVWGVLCFSLYTKHPSIHHPSIYLSIYPFFYRNELITLRFVLPAGLLSSSTH